jgi:branched-chain amino acid transport system permease protein
VVINEIREYWPAISLSIFLGIVWALTAAFGSDEIQQIVTEMMIRIVVVVGLYIFIGNSGLLSFGHISFMAIGAYAQAWLTCCTLPMVKQLYTPGLPSILIENSYPFWVGVAGAALLSGGSALVIGAVLMRLSGIAASIATFALLSITFSIYINWDTVTGGASSISNIPVDVGPGMASGFAIATVCIAFLYATSRYGLMLRASRDDAVAARAVAVNIYLMRLTAFVLSAIFVGIGGALFASFLGTLGVNEFYLATTFLTLAMLIVGGVASLSGAVIGVLFLTSVTEILRHMEAGVTVAGTMFQLPKGFQEVCLGIIMIAILLYRPAGLTNGRELPWPFARGRTRPQLRLLSRLFIPRLRDASRRQADGLEGSSQAPRPGQSAKRYALKMRRPTAAES